MDVLALRDNAKQQLSEIRTIESGVEYLNKMKAVEVWVKAEKKDAELQNIIAEQKLRTQRILGGLLKESEVSKNQKNTTSLGKAALPRLSDIGITKYESSTFQKIASLPEEVFEQEIYETKEKKGELTSAQMLKASKIIKRKEDVRNAKEAEATLPEGDFNVIVIDPPWKYGREYDPDNSRIASPYPEMSQQQLMELQIPAAENSVVWLWTTQRFIWDAHELLEHWGFDYKAILTWDKQKIGLGSWLRMQTEFCLLGFKGSLVWNLTNQRDIISEARRQHSRKPEAFYDLVESICYGRKLDYFSRQAREGWASFGNEATKYELAE